MEIRAARAPRILLLFVGLLLGFLGVVCLLWTAALVQTAVERHNGLQWVAVAVSALFSGITLSAAYRLTFNRPRRTGGLFPNSVLYVGGCFLMGLPIAAIITGDWRQLPLGLAQLATQGTLYFFGGVGCFVLARSRRQRTKARAELIGHGGGDGR